MNKSKNERMNDWMNKWMNEWMNESTNEWISSFSIIIHGIEKCKTNVIHLSNHHPSPAKPSQASAISQHRLIVARNSESLSIYLRGGGGAARRGLKDVRVETSVLVSVPRLTVSRQSLPRRRVANNVYGASRRPQNKSPVAFRFAYRLYSFTREEINFSTK